MNRYQWGEKIKVHELLVKDHEATLARANLSERGIRVYHLFIAVYKFLDVELQRGVNSTYQLKNHPDWEFDDCTAEDVYHELAKKLAVETDLFTNTMFATYCELRKVIRDDGIINLQSEEVQAAWNLHLQPIFIEIYKGQYYKDPRTKLVPEVEMVLESPDINGFERISLAAVLDNESTFKVEEDPLDVTLTDMSSSGDEEGVPDMILSDTSSSQQLVLRDWND